MPRRTALDALCSTTVATRASRELGAIDFAQVAMACGADGFRCNDAATLRSALAATLASPRTALLEVRVDPAEPVTTPQQLKA